MASEGTSPSAFRSQETVKLVPAEVLIERGKEIHGLIAHRAYEIFERRGRTHGFDIADWLWAESELLYPCRHELKQLSGALVLTAEMPGGFTKVDVALSVEPRRLIVSGERQVDAICGDPKGIHIETVPERVFRMHDLPEEIDPSRATAILRGNVLEVVMPKMAPAGELAKHGLDL